jgi:hypothetical protein
MEHDDAEREALLGNFGIEEPDGLVCEGGKTILAENIRPSLAVSGAARGAAVEQIVSGKREMVCRRQHLGMGFYAF